MSSKDPFDDLLSKKTGFLAQANAPPSPSGIDPHRSTFHLSFPTASPAGIFSPPGYPDLPRDSYEGAVAVCRRHFVMHDPDICGPGMQCGLREALCPARMPGIDAGVLNIPRAHVVPSSRTPVRYDVGALWSRALYGGVLVGDGDRVWIDGAGEVVLEESRFPDASPYWKFFSAETWYDGVVELAVEWKYARLTPEEYERRAGGQPRKWGGGRIRGYVVAQMGRIRVRSGEIGLWERLVGAWASSRSRLAALLSV